MKNYKVLAIINFILIFYLFFLSIGYAFFNESLTINGVAKTVDFYSGNSLPNTSIKRDSKNNHYYTVDKMKDKIYYFSENWNNDTYELVFKKTPGLKPGEFTSNITISFKNPTVLKYTNGTAKSDISSGGAEDILEIVPSLSKTVVMPGETVDLTVKIRHNFPKALGWVHTKTTVSYNCQNSTKYFYFMIRYQYGW